MLERVKDSVGRVSFTSDIWSAQNLQSYMAITAHYIMRDARTGRLELRSDLVAFRALDKSHTGAYLASEFIEVLKEIKCMGKVCSVLSFRFMILTSFVRSASSHWTMLATTIHLCPTCQWNLRS